MPDITDPVAADAVTARVKPLCQTAVRLIAQSRELLAHLAAVPSTTLTADGTDTIANTRVTVADLLGAKSLAETVVSLATANSGALAALTTKLAAQR